LYALLHEHWHEGPKALLSAGLGTDVMCEPGLLASIKLMTQEHGATGLPRTQQRITSDRQARMAQIAMARHQVAAAWQMTTLGLVREFCRRFEAASPLEPEGTTDSRDADLASAGLSLGLPPGTRLTAARRIEWPQAVRPRSSEELSGEPMRVSYLRIEGATTPSTLRAFFRRKLRSHDEHSIDGGVRLECVRNGGVPGQQQSIDVLITRAGPTHFTLPDQEQPLRIEVLSVEITDPRGPSPGVGTSGETALREAVSADSEF